MSGKVKINTGGMVEKTQSVMDCLNKMAEITAKLHGTASDYNDRIQDGLMSDMVDTLDQIGREIAEVKKKMYEFTKSKNEGAKELDEALKKSRSKTRRV